MMAVGTLPMRLAHRLTRLRPDGFVLSLVIVVATASLLPCDGTSERILRMAGKAAIALLFFLQGARLSREAVVNGVTHWRLHSLTAVSTFVVFPLLGLAMAAMFHTALPAWLWLGVLFACALPSTVQSSIALTSMAEGNVAGCICSATLSNLAGIVLTPILFGMMAKLHGAGFNVQGIGQIALQLLAPFVAGHLLQPWIGQWALRNRSVLSVTDRGSVLLVVYTAFSSAAVTGIWHQVPPRAMAALSLIVALLLVSVLAIIITACRIMRLSRSDEVAAVFCGLQKSMVSGVPIANALFATATIGPMLLPLMIYYPLQLVVCAWLARWYARRNVEPLSRGVGVAGEAAS